MSRTPVSSIEITDPFARRLLAKYLQRRKSDLARLRTDLAAEDYAAIELNGHNLFGSGAAYGLEEVSILGAKLEEAAQAKQSERIEQLIDALDSFVSQVTIS